MGVYVGHFADMPADQFIAIADSFQDALDCADMVGQADESSVRPVSTPFRMLVGLTQYDDALWLQDARPDPTMNAWKTKVHAVSRGGPTGDTIRSYGPKCSKCRANHFKDQECRVFLETENTSIITLFASKSKPGQGVIEVHQGQPLSDSDDDLVAVGDMDDLGTWGLLLFQFENGAYDADDDGLHIEQGQEQLLEAYKETDLPLLPLNKELADEFDEEAGSPQSQVPP